MLKVFISASSLERLCLDEMSLPLENQSNWFVLLTKQNTIYLDKDICQSWTCDDPLFMFSQSYQITLKEATSDYNSEAVDNPASLLNHPQDVFILDIGSAETEAIKDRYGVMCQSTRDLSDCAISESGCHFDLVKNEHVHNWSELFAENRKVPANSLIIVDRYIFGYEGRLRSGYADGVNNIKQILHSALPDNLDCTFDVLIIFDATSSPDRNFNIVQVAIDLEDFKNNVLQKPYNIDIELLSLTSRCARYEGTHNRRILSNYCIVKAEHLLKAFNRKGESITSQSLDLDYSYSKGLRSRDDVPQKSINDLVTKLQDMYRSARYEVQNNTSLSSEYIYYINGQLDTVDHLKNRLILNS